MEAPLTEEQIELLRKLPADKWMAKFAGDLGVTDRVEIHALISAGFASAHRFNPGEDMAFWRTKEGSVLVATLDSQRERVLGEFESFDFLCDFAQKLLDKNYPADVPLVCDRHSDDPGPRLAAAIRDVLEVRSDGPMAPLVATPPAGGTAGGRNGGGAMMELTTAAKAIKKERTPVEIAQDLADHPEKLLEGLTPEEIASYEASKQSVIDSKNRVNQEEKA